MFQPVPSNVNFHKLEEEILRFWREQKIYEKSLDRRRSENAPRFVFYEGPPTANGMPHPGHCLTRAIKDLFPRYRTMRGYLCERKAGWDTHGLPVEVEVCKELGIHSKEDIEKFGIEPFIQKCQQSVWRYMQEWQRMTERIGFWVDLNDAYVTYHQSYVESVWWSLKQLFDRGLLYQGYKIVWWWAQGGTALSAGEVGQGYREVADPSVYVRFPMLDENANEESDQSLLVWTTTPWTLPSNQFAAVHPDLDYSVLGTEIEGKPHRLIIAADLVDAVRTKTKQDLPEVDKRMKGVQLVGHMYRPPFDFYYKTMARQKGRRRDGLEDFLAWRVVEAEFVTTDSGTGIVHQAPAFGEVDFDVLIREQARFESGQGPQLICAVGPDGKFTAEAPDYEGQWVKSADKQIIHDLKNRGLLFHREEYRHEYPFCWRAEEDPLIQYPRRSWFIKTSEFKDRMLENNRHINWLPEHIKDGRFGNFLETNVDWALSRERFWGTPLPIWVCEKTGKMEAVANYDELIKKPGIQGTEVWAAAKKANPKLADDLRVHKPYIDEITYDSPFEKDARMKRVTEVIDCWYDSGAMPFAQWSYQGESDHKAATAGRAEPPSAPLSASGLAAAQKFHEQFPADFISEALDQTRGWFYSQLAISTLVFDKPIPRPFRNCIVLGLMLGEDGQKMSKSKRNYREPNEIFDKYGADALRWYFFATQPPWTTIRYSERAIRDSIPEFLLRLWHTYSFFVIYANIDGFDPAAEIRVQGSGFGVQDGTAACGLASADLAAAKSYRPIKDRAELDRWILSELNRTAKAVVERMDAYDNYGAAQRIIEFVDALSNWYVRRSRDRFWSEDKRDTDKLDAYWTLYEALLTTAKIIAPFVPFLAEAIWRNLATAEFDDRVLESVHLTDFPTGDAAVIDANLSEEMSIVREIVSLGRSARTSSQLKVRQPLRKVEITVSNDDHRKFLNSHRELIADELNVKEVDIKESWPEYVQWSVLPNLKLLGPKLGKRLRELQLDWDEVDAVNVVNQLEDLGTCTIELDSGAVVLEPDDVIIRLSAEPGWSAAHSKVGVVALQTELSDDLILEGLAREIVHVIQARRKEFKLEFVDRIRSIVITDSSLIESAIQRFEESISRETLSPELKSRKIDDEKEKMTQYGMGGANVSEHVISHGVQKLTFYLHIEKM